MLDKLLGSLVDKEAATGQTIQSALIEIAEELQCDKKDFFVMIKPMEKTEKHPYGFGLYIYKIENGIPKLIREISLKEILGDE